jgi:UDP-N-acetylmuramate--alanine ligase
MTTYFFCGIGGSGMLPLALILQGQGATVSGSDRSYDQGRTPEKFSWIKEQGIPLFSQDGSGVTGAVTALVVSTAVEDSIPDVAAAKKLGIPIIKRAELLAERFNNAEARIAVAGTSGKSTTTGMIGYVLHAAGLNPTVMNGAVFKNFQTPKNPYATALSGDASLFVTEADESDGSISFYNPTIAVLNNIALDHKTMDELKELFDAFLSKADTCVLNLDNQYVADMASHHTETCVTYALDYPTARLIATDIVPDGRSVSCLVTDQHTKQSCALKLQVPGRHNISNALACIGTCLLLGLSLKDICTSLGEFTGIKRRMEVIGSRNLVTVIDDFAHNPDKITATLSTLKESPGNIHIIFQIHGYNPIRLMRREFADVFSKYLGPQDSIYIPEVLYLGGTVDRSVTAQDLVNDMRGLGINAHWLAKREDALPGIIKSKTPGDRIVVMGARDDTLSEFARDILNRM